MYPRSGPLARPTWPVAGLLGCVSLLSACVSSTPMVHKKRLPDPPPRLPPALLSILGDEPGLKVTAVDGVQWEGLADAAVLRDPNVPIGRYRDLGVWLAPGTHVIHAKYFRNIVGGVTFVQGDLRLRAVSGHTYMVHPSAESDYGKVSFTLVDYGLAFPQACLPGAISNAKQVGKSVRYERFTRDEVVRCLQVQRAPRALPRP